MSSVLRSHYNKTRGGLGRVCATGMYRSIERVKFPKFRTGIFVEWKAPLYPVYNAIGLIFLVSRRNLLLPNYTYPLDRDLSGA